MSEEKDNLSRFGDDESLLLYNSLEDLKQQRKNGKQPTVVLGSLCALFLLSAGGIALAVLMNLNPLQVQGVSAERNLIICAASTTIFYVGLHVGGAARNYTRTRNGPPQLFRNYLHMGALVLARISILIWVAALVATVFILPGSLAFVHLLSGKLPLLNALVCTAVIPCFIIISCSIESSANPFATAGLSRSSSLTSRSDAFADDLAADFSISRRASIQKRYSGRPMTTVDYNREMRYTRRAHSFHRPSPKAVDNGLVAATTRPQPQEHSMGSLRHQRTRTQNQYMRVPAIAITAAPEPTYRPADWRQEWNQVANEVGLPAMTESSIAAASNKSPSSSYSSSHYSSESGGSSQTSVTQFGPSKKRRASPSSSIVSSAQRSSLSTVRYASKPNLAVTTAVKVVKSQSKGPRYSPATVLGNDRDTDVDLSPPTPPNLIEILMRPHQVHRNAADGRPVRLGSSSRRALIRT